MTPVITNPVELRQRGFEALVASLGWVNAVRFLHQYEVSDRDYTRERNQNLAQLGQRRPSFGWRRKERNNRRILQIELLSLRRRVPRLTRYFCSSSCIDFDASQRMISPGAPKSPTPLARRLPSGLKANPWTSSACP